MQRLFDYTLASLRHDPAAVAAALTASCRRQKVRLVGLCQTEDRVCFVAQPAGLPPAGGYVIVPEPKIVSDSLAATLSERWTSGFDAIGLIRLEPWQYLGVYGVMAPRQE